MRRNKSKQKSNGVSALGVVGIIAIIGVVAVAIMLMAGVFSVGDTSESDTSESVVGEGGLIPAGVSSELFSKAASLSVKAYDGESASNSQVSTTAYYWVASWDSSANAYGEYEYGGAITTNASVSVSITDVNVGDQVKLIAFDSTYTYGEEVVMTIEAVNDRVTLDVYKASTSQTITFYDENGNVVTNTTSGVTVGTTNYIFEKIRITNTDDYSRIVPRAIGFDYVEASNISEVRVSGLTEISDFNVKLLSGVEHWYDLSGNILNNDITRFDTGSVTISPDGDNVASETLTVYVKDLAPYITEDKKLAYAVQDDTTNKADVGISDLSQAITLV